MGVDGDSRQDDPTDAKKEREVEVSDVPVDRMKNMARNMFRKEFTSVARRIEQAVVKELHESLEQYFGMDLTTHEEVPPDTEALMDIITKLGEPTLSDVPTPTHKGSPKFADAVHFQVPLLGPSSDRRPSIVAFSEGDFARASSSHVADPPHFPLPWLGRSAKVSSECNVSESGSASDPEFVRVQSQAAPSVNPLETLEEPLFVDMREGKQTFGDKLRRGRKQFTRHKSYLPDDIAVELFHIAESRRLACGIALAIVLNALFIGLQTHEAAVNCTVHTPTIF